MTTPTASSSVGSRGNEWWLLLLRVQMADQEHSSTYWESALQPELGRKTLSDLLPSLTVFSPMAGFAQCWGYWLGLLLDSILSTYFLCSLLFFLFLFIFTYLNVYKQVIQYHIPEFKSNKRLYTMKILLSMPQSALLSKSNYCQILVTMSEILDTCVYVYLNKHIFLFLSFAH